MCCRMAIVMGLTMEVPADNSESVTNCCLKVAAVKPTIRPIGNTNKDLARGFEVIITSIGRFHR